MGHAKKDAIYQLIDNFTLFHFQFIRERRGRDNGFWTLSYTAPALNTWRGLAFERLCLWHLPQLRAALGISEELSKLAEREAQFVRQTGTRKAVLTVLVAASGVKRNTYSGNIHFVVTLDDLFRD